MTARIAYLVSRYPGTTHTFIRREVDALRRKGVAVETFSVRQPFPGEIGSSADAMAHQETFYVLPLSPVSLLRAHVWAVCRSPSGYFSTFIAAIKHRAPGTRASLWSLFHFAEALVLARELRRRNITHLHNHFANAGATVGFLASRYLRMPWSLTLHGISETDYPAGLLLAEKIRAARFVACVSWFGQAQAMRLVSPQHWPKFSIVRCALDLPSLPRRDTRSPGNVPRVICVGRLSSEKGHFGLISALAAIRTRDISTHLTLVGDGPERAAIEQYAAAHLPAENFTFVGRLDESDTLMACAEADLLVLPSFMEGLPVVLMEAMALGTPVVASRIAGVPELIADGLEGRLFTPANWPELADVLVEVFSAPDQTARQAIAARLKIEREFDIEKAVAPLVKQFSE